MQARPLNIYPLSEQSVVLSFGDEVSEDILKQISAYHRTLQQNPFAGYTDAVAAYTTLTVFYDALQVLLSDLPGADAFEKVSNYLMALAVKPAVAVKPANIITIPVFYGDDFGPDLEALATFHQLSVEEVISIHTRPEYIVYMIGFVPGFAYLGGLDGRLETPRLATPRPVIPAGSVGIAGKQTGVYPLETPGGWQLIGRTPLKMFGAGRAQPSLLQAGDKVKFAPISKDDFNQLSKAD
ncbi:inhibitor of KinA [Mucilaginibacter yixingensis]|uniref:Inhibitor of KinA n=1 Tax=Mucilaginibacter yixingensis TaxID=1295612 RepID=A0A2T5JGS8_9SPHI|nr:5-oxoprolinase subunit PxpB [Mucilaginibacter yixingensis]PTR01618.1 inhibitor of KinA [Mucilaginibacter yixingensis]